MLDDIDTQEANSCLEILQPYYENGDYCVTFGDDHDQWTFEFESKDKLRNFIFNVIDTDYVPTFEVFNRKVLDIEVKYNAIVIFKKSVPYRRPYRTPYGEFKL